MPAITLPQPYTTDYTAAYTVKNDTITTTTTHIKTGKTLTDTITIHHLTDDKRLATNTAHLLAYQISLQLESDRAAIRASEWLTWQKTND